MAENYGYTGKILRIDLSSGRTGAIPTSDYSGKFFGGRGIAAKIYWDEVPPGAKALSSENKMILMTGPLAGFPSIGSSRWQACGKSPYAPQEYCSYSNFGGGWGARLKFAGFDGLVIEGKAEEPAYILIEEGKVRIEKALFMWGTGSFKARELLKRHLRNASILTIGQAGENEVNIPE